MPARKAKVLRPEEICSAGMYSYEGRVRELSGRGLAVQREGDRLRPCCGDCGCYLDCKGSSEKNLTVRVMGRLRPGIIRVYRAAVASRMRPDR